MERLIDEKAFAVSLDASGKRFFLYAFFGQGGIILVLFRIG